MFRSVTRAVRALCIVHCRCGHGRGAEHVGKLDHGIVARMSACEIRGRIPVEMVHLFFSCAPSGEHRQWVDAGLYSAHESLFKEGREPRRCGLASCHVLEFRSHASDPENHPRDGRRRD